MIKITITETNGNKVVLDGEFDSIIFAGVACENYKETTEVKDGKEGVRVSAETHCEALIGGPFRAPEAKEVADALKEKIIPGIKKKEALNELRVSLGIPWSRIEECDGDCESCGEESPTDELKKMGIFGSIFER